MTGRMTRQAVNSQAIQAGLLPMLLGSGALWSRLRRGDDAQPQAERAREGTERRSAFETRTKEFALEVRISGK